MVQYVWSTGLPFWGLFITLALATLYVIPVGTVYAVANLNANVLTVLGEIVSGYLLKGKPLVLLIFKVRFISPAYINLALTDRLVLCIYWSQSSNVLRC